MDTLILQALQVTSNEFVIMLYSWRLESCFSLWLRVW